MTNNVISLGNAPVRPTWWSNLKLNASREPMNTDNNMYVLLSNAPEFAGAWAFDSFRQEIVWTRDESSLSVLKYQPLRDSHIAKILEYLAAAYQCHSWKRKDLVAAIGIVAREHSIDPLIDYLDKLVWDGTPRINHWLTTYLGAHFKEAEVACIVGRKWLISAIARAYRPGCQADHTLVLEGAQGLGKSRALRILGGEFYSSMTVGTDTKDAMIENQGAWIREMEELASLDNATIEVTKAFLTRADDKYRGVYETRATSHPRRCVFAASTNDESFLADDTGGRRFWPITVTHVNFEMLTADRDQLWAEAKTAFLAGERWHLSTQEEVILTRAQAHRIKADPWENKIFMFASEQSDAHRMFTLPEALNALAIPLKDQNMLHLRRVGAVLRKLGYDKKQYLSKATGRKQVVWFLPETFTQQPTRDEPLPHEEGEE